MAPYDFTLEGSLWDTRGDYLDFPNPSSIRQSYNRARKICQKSSMTTDDIVDMTAKFWDFNRELVAMRDMAVTIILVIHWNLCMGTIGKFARRNRQDLLTLLEGLERFDICGEYLLTELGHGLDARNLETTATLQPDGSFILHTPSLAAAKAMPPTTPWAGVSRVAVVFARIIANQTDCGVKPFIVKLCEADQMCPGVTSRLLPRRNGSKELDHAITTFNHVRLSPSSLLGSPKASSNERASFLSNIDRVSVGTLSLTMWNIPALKQCAYIAGTYSFRRHVSGNKPGQTVPIISFATQYRPILNALAQAAVFNAFADDAIRLFCDSSLSPEVRHSVAACFKATVTVASQVTINELADRCGWQGLFSYNRIIELAMSMRGNSIAEGDFTVLCIRLASEVLLGRYALPPATMKDCLLARHEAGVWQEAKEIIASLPQSNHRGAAFNAYILPRCRSLVEATGHRMAYEAAVRENKVAPGLARLFESSCVMSDLSWYCDQGGFKRKELIKRDVEAVEAIMPELQTLLKETEAAPWTTAPLVKEGTWNEFVHNLPTFQFNEAVQERSRL